MRLRSVILGLVLLVFAASASWLAVYGFLISQEDYSPERGSLRYYVGISSLIRNAPATGTMAQPAYFGSVGDGNKPPQSEMTFETSANDITEATAAITSYLRQKDFHQRSIDAENAAASFVPEGERLVQYAQYASSAGEVAVLAVTQAMATGLCKVTLTHYD
ncbi:hypothetical protein DR66_166 [Delftia acidovorans]|nr:hypothetical protein DR66_166 [Delftia acidovorans]QQB50489.1 hypothetical protein I6H54_29880 [Delftia acidovorans]